jgi:hypothetical protein
MSAIRIQVFIDDGPRAGATLTIDSGPDGKPPDQLVLDHPLGPNTTTYYLCGLDEPRKGYVYRITRPSRQPGRSAD